MGHHNDSVTPLVDSETLIIDGKGHSIIPGFVDAHTHSLWSGDRLFEFDLKMFKLASTCYLDIPKASGVIYFTANCTTKSTENELTATYESNL